MHIENVELERAGLAVESKRVGKTTTLICSMAQTLKPHHELTEKHAFLARLTKACTSEVSLPPSHIYTDTHIQKTIYLIQQPGPH